MRKNIRIPLKHSYSNIKKILPLVLFSCVYYNTFYNAEVNYKKAEKIIEQSPPKDSEDDKISPQAKKLLGQAIENSNIVIESYPNSKYVDDAYFIIGKASFLRKEFFNAEKYLKKIIELYPDSEYCNESRLWLIYTYLKMDNLDLAKSQLNELDYENYKNQFLINNILAEISIAEDNPFKAYEYYNRCLSLTKDKSQKTSVYLKLLNISKGYNHIDSAVVYLDKMSEYTTGQMTKEIKLDWIKYSRQASNFDDLLVEIDVMLANSEYSSIYIKLELEKAKIYLDQNDFESAKIFFSELADKYSRKNESAEALYHLGYIALMENFDLDLALEYFEKSKKDRKSSLYGKRSRDMINRINDYKNINNELEYLLNKDENTGSDEETSRDKGLSNKMMPKPKKQKQSTPDSLLFVISEKLLFDFDRIEDAKISYEDLINTYEESKFRPQALYVLNFYFPDEGWGDILNLEYPESRFSLNDGEIDYSRDDIDLIRDSIWDSCQSSYNICAQEFLELFEKKQDNTSLYFYAFINDNYLNKIEEAIYAYSDYVKSETDLQYLNEANSRLNDIENSIYSSIELTNQKINYYHALESLQSGYELDSVLVKIDSAIEGGFSKYKSSAQSIKSRVNELIDLKDKIISMDDDSLNLNSNIDSLYFMIAKIYQLDFALEDTALIYFEKIINDFPDSKFKYESITSLNDINSEWDDYLMRQYPDSVYISDSSYKQIDIVDEIYQESFIDYELDRLGRLNIYSNLFVNEIDSIEMIDTTNVILDTLNNMIKSNEE